MRWGQCFSANWSDGYDLYIPLYFPAVSLELTYEKGYTDAFKLITHRKMSPGNWAKFRRKTEPKNQNIYFMQGRM